MRATAGLLGALVVALVAGCAQHHGVPASAPVTAPSVAATPTYAPIAAPEACPQMAPVHLPDGVGPVRSAYICATEFRPVPGDGVWQFSVVKGVTSGLDALLRADQAPDAPRSEDPCPALAVLPHVVYLHGTGVLAVRTPEDGCGLPAAAGTRAYSALGTVELSATRIHRITSPLAQQSGCSDAYKDMLAVEEESGGPPQTSKVPSPVALGSELCTYTVTVDPHGYRFTWLSSARRLTGTDVDRINSALSGATVDTSCSRHAHSRFALVQAAGTPGAPTTLVDLDGCAVQQDGGWWRATDRLRALVG